MVHMVFLQWRGKAKPFLFDMSVPQFFITAPCALTGALDFEEGATTESMQKTDGMLPNARPIPAKKRVIAVLKLKDPVQVPNICEKEIIANSFPLSFCSRSPFLTVANPATPANHARNASPRQIS
jgi:hypothetical protein